MATCRCENGHEWQTRVIADEPDTNCTIVAIDYCPECSSDSFEIISMEGDYDDDDWAPNER
jgi:Zn finger protein HypA/HybF involved in hydrogenase expression